MKVVTFGLLFILLAVTGNNAQNCIYSLKESPSATFVKSYSYNFPNLKWNSSNVTEVNSYLIRLTKSSNFPVYDATHDLFVPLVFASTTNNQNTLRCFDNLFTVALVNKVISSSRYSRLEKLGFCFLLSEYIKIRYKYSASLNGTPDVIYGIIKKYIINQWTTAVGNNWAAETCNFKGIKSRIAYILTHNNFPKNREYFGAVTDAELYLMATGANLAGYELQKSGSVTSEVTEIVFYFIQTLKRTITFSSDGGWLMQPGIWRNHADYKYAGNKLTNRTLAPVVVSSIGWDASHFSRMPGCLYSLSTVFSPQSETGLYVEKLKKGLAVQFLNKVLITTSAKSKKYLFNNFMDGTNGVYRYKYKTKANGYQPSENYTHVLHGWWGLLGNKEIGSMYSKIYENFDSYNSSNSKDWLFLKGLISLYR